jgi:hypothetical protein
MVDTSTNSWKLLYEAGRQALQARKLQEAEQSFSAALQLAEDFAGGDPRLAATLNALARIYSLQRRYLAAAALLNRLLEVTERTLGDNHVQVAGVLTNLAEMYTHLGAAREELELRERVLSIRADDPNADANALQRLRERVTELRATLAAEEAPAADEIDMDLVPVVRTAEYTAPILNATEPEAVAATPVEPVAPVTVVAAPAPVDIAPAAAVTVPDRDDAYRLSPPTSHMSIAPWPGPAATTPTSAPTVEMSGDEDEDIRPSLSASGVGLISVETSVVPFSGAVDHGFSDMGRDELATPIKRRVGGRSSLISIAAGVVIVAGLLAARSFVGGPDDGRVSAGSVNLATANAPAVVIPPVIATPAPVAESKTVDRLVAERAERNSRRSDEARSASTGEVRPVITERPPRVPTAADMERTLRGLDGAFKTIDQQTKAATDSLSTIRVQAPTFNKVKIANP